jgi:hypothetical protein
MELLAYPKNDYLLDASLDTLHAESQDWLKDMEFWADEMTFFYKLLRKKETSEAFPANDLAAMEKAVIKINSDELGNVRSDVLSHERLLSSVMKSTSMAEEQVYREAHRRLHSEMHNLNALIRSFKKEVFDFYSK